MHAMGLSDINQSDIIGALLATLSGVIVALFTGYLAAGREAARERRLLANARTLLALEVRSNRNALTAFWRTVSVLGEGASRREDGAAGGQATDPVESLAALYAGGLASYTLPTWSTIRWHGLDPRTVAALSPREVAALDSLYRELHDVSDLYSRVSTITPTDWADLQKNASGRFWNVDLARERKQLFSRLNAAVVRVLDAPDPLPGAIAPQK
jgi:hypothetical protein